MSDPYHPHYPDADPRVVQKTKKMPKRETRSVRQRRSLMNRDGSRCHWCQRKLTMDSATLDHVVPRRDDGDSTLENYVLACEPCNRLRGALRELLGAEVFAMVRNPLAVQATIRRIVIKTAKTEEHEEPGQIKLFEGDET